jgi:aspartate racemase
MRESFFRDKLERAGVEVLTPDAADQERINEIIFGELCRAEIRPEAREFFARAIAGLRRRGAEGIVLGCTELPLIVKPEDCDLPLFDTARLHAQRALDYAIAGD